MTDVKFTKTELRAQQVRLDRLSKYLPTLQLKKALLQTEVHEAQKQIDQLHQEFQLSYEKVEKYAALLTERNASDLFAAFEIKEVEKGRENIAGVDIPFFTKVHFEAAAYSLFDTPLWFESAIFGIREFIVIREKIKVGEEKKKALEQELKEVSIRVNLFEKILIPRAQENIRRIKIFLGDQQLAAVSQAKVAKRKLIEAQNKRVLKD